MNKKKLTATICAFATLMGTTQKESKAGVLSGICSCIPYLGVGADAAFSLLWGTLAVSGIPPINEKIDDKEKIDLLNVPVPSSGRAVWAAVSNPVSYIANGSGKKVSTGFHYLVPTIYALLSLKNVVSAKKSLDKIQLSRDVEELKQRRETNKKEN